MENHEKWIKIAFGMWNVNNRYMANIKFRIELQNSILSLFFN